MSSAVRLREDYSAEELRALARRSKTVNQSRRLLRWLRMEWMGRRQDGAWTAKRCATGHR